MTLILHTYTDIRKSDQAETLAELGLIEARYGEKLISEKCTDPDDYWSFLLRHWASEDIVIIEQDVVAKPNFVDDLVMCPKKVCTFPYQLAGGQLSVFNIPYKSTYPFQPFSVDYPERVPTFTDGTSLGFTKICVCIQDKIPLHTYDVGKYEWWYLDSFISWHLKRLRERVHVHPTLVKHNRTVAITFQIGDQSVTLSND